MLWESFVFIVNAATAFIYQIAHNRFRLSSSSRVDDGMHLYGRYGVDHFHPMFVCWGQLKLRLHYLTALGRDMSTQWLKWSCEAGGSPDDARLE